MFSSCSSIKSSTIICDPTEYFRVNVNGTMKIMEWAKKNNVKVIYAGSSSKHHNPSDSPYAMYKVSRRRSM